MRAPGAVAATVVALTLATSLPASAQDWRTIQRSARTGSVERLAVDIGYAAGDLTVRPGEAGTLYALSLRYDESIFTPSIEFERADGTLGVSVSPASGRSAWDVDEVGALDLALPIGVPMALELGLGASRAEIELGGLSFEDLTISVGAAEAMVRVSSPVAAAPPTARFEAGAADLTVVGLGNLGARRVEVDAGVGRTELDFSGALPPELVLEVTMGLGELELRIPDGIGIDLRKRGLLLHLDAEGLQREGERWQSEGLDTADRRITIELDGAVGRVRVVRIPAGDSAGK